MIQIDKKFAYIFVILTATMLLITGSFLIFKDYWISSCSGFAISISPTVITFQVLHYLQHYNHTPTTKVVTTKAVGFLEIIYCKNIAKLLFLI